MFAVRQQGLMEPLRMRRKRDQRGREGCSEREESMVRDQRGRGGVF